MKWLKRLIGLIIFIIVVLLIVMAFFTFYKGKTSSLADDKEVAQNADKDLIKKGDYLAKLGDCMACHTAQDGKVFAGGLGMNSPIGMIYSPNITPDDNTGIGSYTLADFDNAVRYGMRKNGDSLYPAMPFTAYSRLKDDDIKALYAYFMNGVDAVDKEDKGTDIPWPLSMRWPLAAWRMIFAPEVKAFDDSQYDEKELARGAYLVEGLGHCGTCHTPRSNLTLAEKSTDDSSDYFLSGSNMPLDGWIAPNIRGNDLTGIGRMSEDDLVALLTKGQNAHTAVFGTMADAVNYSLKYLKDDDAKAIAKYLKTLSPIGSNPKYKYDDKTAKALANGDDSKPGADVYLDNCAACHRSNGKGYKGVFPMLAGNATVNAEKADNTINLVLDGYEIQSTKKAPSTYAMPGFKERLSDEQIADVVNFVRNSWGNNAPKVSASDVKKLRSDSDHEQDNTKSVEHSKSK